MSFFSNIGDSIKKAASNVADKLNLDTRSILNKEKLNDLGAQIKQSVVSGIKVASGQSSIKTEVGNIIGQVKSDVIPISRALVGNVVPTASGTTPLLLPSSGGGGVNTKPVLFDDVKNEGISPVWLVVGFLLFLVLRKMRVI